MCFENNDSGDFFFILVAAITIKNKEAIDQGFCHLQNVKIQMLLACNLSFNSTVTIALAENETDTSGNYILQCFGIPGKQIDCPQQDYATGAYNECNDILEVEFIFDYTKHIQHYLRIWTDCNSSSIAMKPCRMRLVFFPFISLDLLGKRIFNYIENNSVILQVYLHS